MKTREDIIETLKQYWSSRLSLFLSNDCIDRIFEGSCSQSDFDHDLKVDNLELMAIAILHNFITIESKHIHEIGYLDSIKVMSESLPLIFNINNEPFTNMKGLVRNFEELEHWINHLFSVVNEYNKTTFKSDLKKIINIRFEDLTQVISNSEKLLCLEDVAQLKELRQDQDVELETIQQLINEGLSTKIANICSPDTLTYSLLKKLNQSSIKIDSYESLKNFELYSSL